VFTRAQFGHGSAVAGAGAWLAWLGTGTLPGSGIGASPIGAPHTSQ
jgi:hypothetical protein